MLELRKVGTGRALYWEVEGAECVVTIERRRPTCDRGDFIAKVHPKPGSELALSLDGQDGWPRYYFDWGRMLAEVEAWLRRRGQLPAAPTPPTPKHSQSQKV